MLSGMSASGRVLSASASAASASAASAIAASASAASASAASASAASAIAASASAASASTVAETTVPPSVALHVLALYMKGQKTLYMDAKSHCERRLNWLMLPAIINAAICTVISSALSGWQYGSVLLAALSAFNSCVLAVISYLKLDAKCEAHRASAFQFERLQTLCEFYAGKYLFGIDDGSAIGGSAIGGRFSDTIAEIETKMREIKDSNQFMLPKTIRARYPQIYTTNVFAILRTGAGSSLGPGPLVNLQALERDFCEEIAQPHIGCCGATRSRTVAPLDIAALPNMVAPDV